MAAAAAGGYYGLEDRSLKMAILYMLCIGGAGGAGGAVGSVNPEGVVTANPGSTYYNTANSTFWVKSSGTENTGWTELL